MNELSAREKEIIRRVKRVRLSLDPRPTHKDMGDVLNLSKHGYGHYERGEQPFTVDQLFKLSDYLGRSMQHFLDLEMGLTAAEDELLTLYRQLDEQAREMVLGAMRIGARQVARSEVDTGE